ncbi:MAG: T9SS type A sorting domain-containing protein [Prevotella sp.]
MKTIMLAMTLFLGMPAHADVPGESAYEQQMVNDAKVSISVQNSAIVVNGAAGYDMEIISLTGRRVVKVRIENNSQRIELNVMKGCYIVKIENQSKKDCFVRKVTIQ